MKKTLIAILATTTFTIPAVAADDTWQVGCQPDKCWAMVYYKGQSLEGINIRAKTLFEVDARGVRIPAVPDYAPKLCDESPVGIWVDGVRVDGLPMHQRISAVLAGKMFVREIDHDWPTCNVYNEVTSLSGARAAYDDMMNRWSQR